MAAAGDASTRAHRRGEIAISVGNLSRGPIGKSPASASMREISTSFIIVIIAMARNASRRLIKGIFSRARINGGNRKRRVELLAPASAKPINQSRMLRNAAASWAVDADASKC